MTMVSFPPCKINLGLNIISKRTDGYHNIVTCFYPVPWHDILEIVPARMGTFSVSGEPVPGAAKDNLCIKAYDALSKDFKLPEVSIHLHKNIPLGAGLGGGSADGAYTLRMLNELFSLSLTPDALKMYAARLGSDCAFFIDETPAIGTARGEVLQPIQLSLKGKYLVIVKPEVQISTAEAYNRISPGQPTVDLITILEKHPVSEWKAIIKNDFEENLFQQFPIIEAIHQKLYAFGADFASLSGSGSSVFGIFENSVELKTEFEGLTYWSGYLS
jgi:4-diphosphocytidyl-2-C-methyl-D-erythritol kinase